MAQKEETNQTTKFQLRDDENGLWTMDFDSASGKDGVGIRIWIRSPLHQLCKIPKNVRLCSYKLAFDFSNNDAKYEELITGLKILKNLDAKRITVYGEFELVIKQVKGEY